MNLFGWRKKEVRASPEDPTVPVSADNFLSYFGHGGSGTGAGVHVTVDNALGVPSVWAAVNFLSGTIASLPLHVYQRGVKGRTRVQNSLTDILHDAPNEETTSFDWRKGLMSGVFTLGRGVSFIERAPSGLVINIWPLDPRHVSVEQKGGRKFYHYQDGDRRVVYEAREVIDIPWMLAPDGMSARAPIQTHREAIGRAIASQRYAGRFFENGGVPPFAMTGNFQTPKGMQRAADDMAEAVRNASKEGRLALTLPSGHEIKSLGIDPDKMQLIETQRFNVEEVARIYSLPPTFLQDLTHGTFSNTEQQDLHFVKHTLLQWIDQIEKQLNLKLFGRSKGKFYVEFELDGLMRGDFVSRMSGYAQAIQHGVLTPNEARASENRPNVEHGDTALIQGATVPLGSQQITTPTGGAPNDA